MKVIILILILFVQDTIQSTNIFGYSFDLANNNKRLSSLTKIKLNTDSPYNGILNHSSHHKYVFQSETPFSLVIYPTDGKPLYYKSTYVSFVGYASYYEIKGLDENIKTKVIFEIFDIEPDWIVIITHILSIIAIGILILFKRESKVAKIILLIILILEIYNATDYNKISKRIVHKILF